MLPIGDFFYCNDALMPHTPSVIEIGCFTTDCAAVIFSRWPNARYIAVEPSSANYVKLCDAIGASKLHIRPIRAALADKDGPMPFYVFNHEQLHSGFPRHMTAEAMPLKGIETVQGLTLKSILDMARVDTCDLALLNCEGGEILGLEELARDAELRGRVKQLCTSGHFEHVHIYPKGAWDAAIDALLDYYDVQSRLPVPNIPYYLLTRKADNA